MHVAGLKTQEAYDGKCNNRLKNPCECGTPVLPVFSPIFYVLYLIAGLSDMVDGIIARKTDSVSEFGQRLDGVVDFVFVSVCLSCQEGTYTLTVEGKKARVHVIISRTQ